MENFNAPILTPDQRLRVFVSSTLHELAEERKAIKDAIQNIHLIPVMFELGARSHAPRDLYRQYLAQSQIFVGIYADSYGWVAPEESISGLEDEYNRSGNLPKLIYIKKSGGQRDSRLASLLERIQKDDQVSYKTFSEAGELSTLIMNDLAVLLTERFNLTLQQKISESKQKAFQAIPAVPNSLIGREKNIDDILNILNQPFTRLVTLTGPGGIGKTRLAIETARQLQDSFPDGAVFVPLAPVKDGSLVAETISYALGIKVSGGNILESLKLFLKERNFLLVLDNFEQVIESVSIIDDLLLAAPGLKIMVTSRERLALSYEHIYTVPALSDSCYEITDINDSLFSPAMTLFIQRAKAVQPSFEITSQNHNIVCKICQRLEGLPLAIELAAGQINLFSPAMLLQKLDHRLDILKANFRNIPDRQKTMRNAIEWSFELLTPTEQNLLLQISLYDGGCLMSAIESMCTEPGQDAYENLESLINKSLIIKQDESTQVRFQMLETVREFSLEKLDAQNRLEIFKEKQAEYYHQSLQAFKLVQDKVDHSEVLKLLEKEQPNIRQVLDYLYQKKDLKKLTEIAWNLWLFWWVNAHTSEGYTLLKKVWEYTKQSQVQFDDYTFSILAANVGTMSFLQRDFVTFNESLVEHFQLISKQNDQELIATSSLIFGVVKTIMREYDVAETMLLQSLENYKKIDLATGVSLALSALGRNAIYNNQQITAAKNYYKESMALAKKDQNEIALIICLTGFSLCEVMERNTDAKDYLRESIILSQSLHFYEALAWSIEIWSLLSINENKVIHAVTLMGAVNHLRESTKLPVWDDLEAIIADAKAKIEEQMDPVLFNTAWNEGAAMSLDRMVTYAMEG